MKYASIGSIGASSNRPDELAADYVYTLKTFLARDKDKIRKTEVRRVLAEYEKALAVGNQDAIDGMVEDMFLELFSLYCAPYLNFGEVQGEFGFYPDIESLQEDARAEDGVLQIESGEQWAGRSTGFGYVMEVNDHGNVSLFATNPKRLMWDCV